ncbi:MAG: hypothetical protein L6V85_09225 [Clostridiales bacterium]|nr:MAG: hypothetical protein L6V85_09225 [Clostridiales bacterium]
MQADIAYQPDMYPLLAARRYFSIWAGILAMSIFLSTYFHNKEKNSTLTKSLLTEVNIDESIA